MYSNFFIIPNELLTIRTIENDVWVEIKILALQQPVQSSWKKMKFARMNNRLINLINV